jgi:hypothetical protein
MYQGDYVPFENELHDFLATEMCIDTKELIDKISGLECEAHIIDIYKIISDFFAALKKEAAEEEIQKIFLSYEHLFNHGAAYAIIDPLRHVFDGFAYGGLHQIYTRQENEAWYPKIRLSRELKPNDIATLDEVVIIYRGCSTSEYTSKEYGQSWSTSKDVAKQFSHAHYQNQPWFKPENRIVLQSTIFRSAIFYSKQDCEFEIVVNVNLLGKVMVCA